MWPINDISIWNQWASKEAQPIFSNKTGTGSSSTQIRWTVYVSSWIKKKAVQRSNYTTQVLINVWINHENSWLGLTLRHPLYCYLLFQLNSGLFNYVLPLSSHSWMPWQPVYILPQPTDRTQTQNQLQSWDQNQQINSIGSSINLQFSLYGFSCASLVRSFASPSHRHRWVDQ